LVQLLSTFHFVNLLQLYADKLPQKLPEFQPLFDMIRCSTGTHFCF